MAAVMAVFSIALCAHVAAAAGPSRRAVHLTSGLSVDPSHWYQDAFPWNEAVTPAHAVSFDTAGALVKTGLNIGPGSGLERWDVPGDSLVVTATGTGPMRVDMVFRILPGPGNYRKVGDATSGLAKLPTGGDPTTGFARPPAVAAVNSFNFWESYMANKGPFGTPGGHFGGTKWDPNTWNSARCDTAELELFPLVSRGIGVPAYPQFSTTYHESEMGIPPAPEIVDPYAVVNLRSNLGTSRHRCFLADPLGDANDIECAAVPPWVTSNAPDDGYNLVPTSSEHTKIIPDGLLTPGSHVEYFFLKCEDGTLSVTDRMPDTTVVVPQVEETNVDGHRWQEFSILPDRWKTDGFKHPVLPGGVDGLIHTTPACMLVVDAQDGVDGDEMAWDGTADSLGVTSNQKWGAHNGYHRRDGFSDPNLPAQNVDRDGRAVFIAEHGGSPGSGFDMYQIKGSGSALSPAGSFGARYSFQDPSNVQVYYKRQRGAPTLEQLRTFYSMILILTGNRNVHVWGPHDGRSADDTQLIKEWLNTGNPTSLNRMLCIQGTGFVESNANENVATGQLELNQDYLGVDWRGNLRSVAAGATNDAIMLVPANGGPLDHVAGAGVGPPYGMWNYADQSLDVLDIAAGAVQTEASVLSYYQDPDPSDLVTYPSGILKNFTSGGPHPWVSLVDGFRIGNLGRSCGPCRPEYYFDVLTKIFTGVCTNFELIYKKEAGLPDQDRARRDFLELATGNPLTGSGSARLHFGIAQEQPIRLRLVDLNGRVIRTLADRTFAAGEHDIVWDGTDDGGHPAACGVYFVQLRLSSDGFTDARKLIVLR